MEQLSFNALDLYCLAYLAGKQNMYGIPDIYTMIPDEDKLPSLQSILNSLEDRGVVVMDFDGNRSISSVYRSCVEFYCDCDACLIVNRHDKSGVDSSAVFWKKGSGFMRADISGELFCFSETNRTEIEMYAEMNSLSADEKAAGASIAILDVALQKAKRLASESRVDDAVRALLQNGADETHAAVVLDGLMNKTDYYCISLIIPAEENAKEKAWIGSRDLVFEIRAETVNYRPSTTFAVSSANEASAYAKELTAFFTDAGR